MARDLDKEPNLPPRPNPAQISSSMRYVSASCVRPLDGTTNGGGGGSPRRASTPVGVGTFSSNNNSTTGRSSTGSGSSHYGNILNFVIPPHGLAGISTTNNNSSLNHITNTVLPKAEQISSNIQQWLGQSSEERNLTQQSINNPNNNNNFNNNEYLALSHHQTTTTSNNNNSTTNNNSQLILIPRPVSLGNQSSSLTTNSNNNNQSRVNHHLIDFYKPDSQHLQQQQQLKSPEDIERDEKIELVKSLIVNNNNNQSNNNNIPSQTMNNLRSVPPLSSSVPSSLNGISFVANQLYNYSQQQQQHNHSNQINNNLNLNYININNNNSTLNHQQTPNQFTFGTPVVVTSPTSTSSISSSTVNCPNTSTSSSASHIITSPIIPFANNANNLNNNNNNGFTFYQNIPPPVYCNNNYSSLSEQLIMNKINNSNCENNNSDNTEKKRSSPIGDKFQFPTPSTTPTVTSNSASPFLASNSKESSILRPTSIFVPNQSDSSKTIIDMFDPLAQQFEQPVPDTPPPPYLLVASAIATESSNTITKSNHSTATTTNNGDSSAITSEQANGPDSGSNSPKSLSESEIVELLQIEERPIWQQNDELQHFCDHLKALYITITSKSNLTNSGLVFSPQIEIKTKVSDTEALYTAGEEVELSENMATFVVRFHPKVYAKLTNKPADQYNPEKDYIKMCCSINSTVDAIVSHVIFNVDSCDEKYSETINSQDFLLKINGRNEFLVPDTSLATYVYVHQCKAMSLDVSLELVDQTLPELWRPFQRSKSDIDRIQNRFTAEQLLPSELLNRFVSINYYQLMGLIDQLNVAYGTFASFFDISAGITKQEKNKYFTNILNRIQKITDFLSHIESSQLRDDIQTFKDLNERCVMSQGGDFPNLGQLFNKAYFEIIKSLAKIIELYSKCFPVNFRLKTATYLDTPNQNNNKYVSKKSARRKADISRIIDTFSLYIDCGVQGLDEWRHCYSSFALRAIIYHGWNVLDYKYLELCAVLDDRNRLKFNQKLSFNMLISNLPRETRVEFLLIGLKSPVLVDKPLSAQDRIEAEGIASTFLYVFDYEQKYEQGAHLLPFTILKPPVDFPAPLSFNNDESIQEFKRSLRESLHFLDYNSDPSASMLLITVDEFENFDYYFPDIKEQPTRISQTRSMIDTVVPFSRSFSSISDCSTQDSLYGFYGRNINQLDKHNRHKIVNILQRNPLEPMSRLDRELIWENRQTLSDYPGAILKVMNSPPTWSHHDLKIVYQFLEQFDSFPSANGKMPMSATANSSLKLPFNTAIEALQLLNADFTDTNLRQMAVRWLSTVSIDELCDYLPQLVQSLRYESYVYCPLIWLLFESSLNSVRFCHFFYWNLNLCLSDPLFGDRCEIYINSLLILCGQRVREMFIKQDSLCTNLANVCAEIKAAKETSRNKLLASRLEKIHEILSEDPISIPLSPSMQVCGLEVSQCSYFSSNSLPLKIVFHGTPQYQSIESPSPALKNLPSPSSEIRKTLTQIIFKCGDDLRQDMLVMQIISIINRIWLRDGLDLRLIIFGVMNNADRTGMIEMVGRAKTLRQIQVQHGVTGSFKQNTISDWLKGHNPSQFDYCTAVGNFVHSCAGYVVITYLLGICDRHNDNIMVTTTGHLFHIDFGKFLGDAQMMAGIKRDRAPFVFTADMAYVINAGDKPTKEYHYFVDLCCNCFSLIRQNGHFLLSLFSLMIPSGICGLTPDTIKYFHNALMPQYSDSEARAQFNRLIEKALGSFATQFNFFLHNIAQMRFSSGAEASGSNYEAIRGSDSGIGIDSPIGDDSNLTEMDQSCCDFSFNKRRFTQAIDGKIVRVEVVGVWKHHEDLEKVYYYKTKVERKNFPDAYVYRSYKEFVELNEKISDFFKMAKFVRLSRSPLLGRSNTHEVAEQRCTEIRQFLCTLMSMASEISHSDMVYTFFHSMNRDQEFLEEHQAMIEARHSNTHNSLNQMLYSNDARGQIKLGITYRDRKLQILVSHAKNLKSTKNPAGPDTYVKLYLLPDNTKSTKRKTRVVYKSAFPTYMESLVYENIYLEEVKKRNLEASVWEHDSLGSRCLGRAYISLGQLDLSAKTEDWFPLECNNSL